MASAHDGKESNRAFYVLVARFLSYLFLASLAFSMGKAHEYLEPMQVAIASGAAMGARVFGDPAKADGPYIAIQDSPAIFINHECTGVFVLVIYASFLLAYPATWLWRGIGIVVGGIILEAVNVLRLAFLAVIAFRWPDLFEYFHEYVWQGIFVALLALLVAVWIDSVNRQAVVLR